MSKVIEFNREPKDLYEDEDPYTQRTVRRWIKEEEDIKREIQKERTDYENLILSGSINIQFKHIKITKDLYEAAFLSKVVQLYKENKNEKFSKNIKEWVRDLGMTRYRVMKTYKNLAKDGFLSYERKYIKNEQAIGSYFYFWPCLDIIKMDTEKVLIKFRKSIPKEDHYGRT